MFGFMRKCVWTVSKSCICSVLVEFKDLIKQ